MSDAGDDGKRSRIANALDSAGVLDRLLWLRGRLGRGTVTVLTYHRVGRAETAELDPDVFEVEPEHLEAQLAVIREHGTPVSLTDLLRLRRGRPLPPNPVMVTFDDGYRDAHDVALPLLRRAGVPATFFIPTAFPDAGRLFWWDRVRLHLKRSRVEEARIDYPERLTLRPATAPAEAAKRVCFAIKRARAVDLPRLWEALERATGVAIGRDEERAIAARTIAGWRDLRALRDAGMDVQSHSHAHVVLNTLTPEGVRRDLERSADRLREALGEAPQVIAYPVGYELHGALRNATAEAGFELGFTNGTGFCRLDRLDPLNMPRVSMDRGTVGGLYKLHLLLGERPRPSWPGEDAPEP